MEVGKYTYGSGYIKTYFSDSGQELTIGKFCSIAEEVRVFLGGEHQWRWGTTYPFGDIHGDIFKVAPMDGHRPEKGSVTIGNDVWIANGVTIMSGVTIGDGSVLANNSHIVKDVGPYEVWGGNPAKLICKRFPDEIINRMLKLAWWDLPEEVILSLIPFLQCIIDDEVMFQLELIAEKQQLK